MIATTHIEIRDMVKGERVSRQELIHVVKKRIIKKTELNTYHLFLHKNCLKGSSEIIA